MVPLGVMRPILLPSFSVNQRLPSGPRAMFEGQLLAVGTGNSLMVPLSVMRPILLPEASVNHIALSGPSVMPKGSVSTVGIGNSLMMLAAGVMRRILPALYSGKQILPSAPSALAASQRVA